MPSSILGLQCTCISVCARSLQSCPILCDPMDRSLPGSSVHGIPQTGIPEWVLLKDAEMEANKTHRSLASGASSLEGIGAEGHEGQKHRDRRAHVTIRS